MLFKETLNKNKMTKIPIALRIGIEVQRRDSILESRLFFIR